MKITFLIRNQAKNNLPKLDLIQHMNEVNRLRMGELLRKTRGWRGFCRSWVTLASINTKSHNTYDLQALPPASGSQTMFAHVSSAWLRSSSAPACVPQGRQVELCVFCIIFLTISLGRLFFSCSLISTNILYLRHK